MIAAAPAGLSAEVLRNRPDVVEAEHQLKAAYEGVGAARAARFPTITLTTAAGLASSALGSLVSAAAQGDSGAVSASLPLFGGTTRANLEAARGQQAYAAAAYDKAVQGAFRDVAAS